MKKVITFTDTSGAISQDFYPKPASDCIPSWYKEMSSYKFGKKEVYRDGFTPQTIKRCMPVFDAFTAGYILFTYVDIYIRTEDGAPYYTWPSFKPIEFHDNAQFDKYPRAGEKFSAPKWVSPWSIKTPKGYSSLILPPIHQDTVPFEILEGLVDTDVYNIPVNFPFFLKDNNFNGLIPAGTPMAQIIPIKRDNWEHEIGNTIEKEEQGKQHLRLKTKFFDSYKTLFRMPKEYK